MAQGYVCVVGTSEGGSSKVELDENTEVIFSSLKNRGWLKSGYIFAVERETGKSIWSKPVRFESFSLLDGIPYDSPFLMLIRRASYRPLAVRAKQATGNKVRVQVAMLDMATGQLKNNYLLKVPVVNEPRVQMVCLPGREYQSNQDDQSEQEESNQDDVEDQRLELLIASQRYGIQLTESEEDAKITPPAILSHEASVMTLGDDAEKIADGEGVNLVFDLEPMAQRAKEANDAMLELGKLEAELFEKQRKARQQQR